MTVAPQFQTRRATIEDLPQLIPLWRLEQLPAQALEKRFTEFQLVTDEAGVLLAAIGLKISGPAGWLHSEAIARQELAGPLRELLWKRLQVAIQNHALELLWTQVNAGWWREQGFAPADAEKLTLLPPAFGNHAGTWNVMTLRAATARAALEHEFAHLKILQQEEAARLQTRVRWLKRLALGFTVLIFLIMIGSAVMLKYGPKIFGRP